MLVVNVVQFIVFGLNIILFSFVFIPNHTFQFIQWKLKLI